MRVFGVILLVAITVWLGYLSSQRPKLFFRPNQFSIELTRGEVRRWDFAFDHYRVQPNVWLWYSTNAITITNVVLTNVVWNTGISITNSSGSVITNVVWSTGP